MSSDPTVEALVSAWRELLAKPDLDAASHFFANGGTSLLAARLIARIQKEMQVRLSLKRVFGAPTPQQLALLVRELQLRGASTDRQ